MRSPIRLSLGLLFVLVVRADRAVAQVPVSPGHESASPPASIARTFPPMEPAARSPEPLLPRGLLQQPSPAATEAPEHFTPPMLGDFIGPVANRFSDVKIAEGESPRPEDRFYYNFNYFNNLEKTRWTNPVEPIHNVALFRHVFGFEKAFFDQSISLGLRVPFYTLDAEAKDFRMVPLPGPLPPLVVPGGPGFTTTHFGNISAAAKVLLWEDRQTGSLLSGGAVVSFPTASSTKINPGQSVVSFAQPFAGFILKRGDFFVQGFSSVTLAIASVQSIVLFNDIGVGYFVYRDTSGSGLLTAIVPTFEVHVATPLRQVDPSLDLFGISEGLRVHNEVNLTFGTTFEFMHRATLGVGVVLPTTGPKPFDFEALAQLNYRF